jgi:uncharacterized SAM-binding protein YcdF (DUF218 family)
MKGQESADSVLDMPSPQRESERRKSWSLLVPVLKTTFLSLLVAALLLVGGFGWFVTHISRLATPKDPGNADAIIVLTGGQARIDAALRLLKSGKGRRLLISGVNPIADLDDLRVVTGGDKTLFDCCVDIDHAALDTIGNAEESAKWIGSHAYNSVILVTNNYHMPRSLLEMRRLLHGAELKPYPVVNSRLDNGGWMTKPATFRVLLTEYTKYLAALARGLLPVRPPPAEIEMVDAVAASAN